MPESWRPPLDLKNVLNTSPWSAGEKNDAIRAAEPGVDELSDFYCKYPAAVAMLDDNALESLLDASHGATNMLTLREKTRTRARELLVPLIAPYLDRATEDLSCRQYSTLLTHTIYAHDLLQPDDPRIARLAAQTNAAYAPRGSFDVVIGGNYRRTLANLRAPIDDVWDLEFWSIVFTDARTIPGLVLPAEARELSASVWHYLADYPLDDARDYPDGARNAKFYDTAYFATHIAYIPTSYGRYPIYVGDAPRLYRFLRQNFYAVLQMGELDLTAEFTDLFRDYGCTEENDLQLRDGRRYLLKLFHSAGDSWMAYREPYEHSDPDSYDLIHKAWTGVSGVRPRVAESPVLGTYGAVVRAWLNH